MPSREIMARETKSPHTEYLSASTFSTEASFSASLCVRHRITDNPETMHVVNY